MADVGATHMWCITTDTSSNLLTSPDIKFTILPEAVSPKAVLLNLKA